MKPALRKPLRLALWLLAIVLVLAAAEWASALWLGHRSTRYLVPGETNGSPAWVDNPSFPLRFALPRAAGLPPPMAAVRDSEDRAYRVCVLTDSTPLGPAPHSADFAFPRQLEALLRTRFPDIPVEVHHMTCPGANSHVLREIARDLRKLRPDAVVVVCGNDELAGPFGPVAAPAFFPAPFRFRIGTAFARPFVLLTRLRLAQALRELLARRAPDAADRAVWTSREPLLAPGWLRPDAPGLADAREAYSDNLDAILSLAAAASPAVLACTTPVNLRDCAPFATAWSTDSETSQLDREDLFRAIANEPALPDESARLYDAILARSPAHAEALYRSGLLALRRGHPDLAATRLSAARDADAFRMRCDSTFNLLMANAADRAEVEFLDAAAIFADRSEGHAPGHELFLDPVHMTFDGHYLLATSILDALSALGALPDGPTADLPGGDEPDRPSPPRPDAGALADTLLYSPWGRADDLAAVLAALREPPFRNQPGRDGAIARLKEEKKHADAQAKALDAVAAAIHARRLAAAPGDPALAALAARSFLAAGDFPAAADAARTALSAWPHRPDIRALPILADLLARDPDAEADDALRASLPDPDADPIGEPILNHYYLLDIEMKRPSREIPGDAKNFDNEFRDAINDGLSAWVSALPEADLALALPANPDDPSDPALADNPDTPWPDDLVVGARKALRRLDDSTAANASASAALAAANAELAKTRAELDKATKTAETTAADLQEAQDALSKARISYSRDPLAATQNISDLIRKTNQLQTRELAARAAVQKLEKRIGPAEEKVKTCAAAAAEAEDTLGDADYEAGVAIRRIRDVWLADRDKLVAETIAAGAGDDRIECLDIPGLWGPPFPEVQALRAFASSQAAEGAEKTFEFSHAELMRIDGLREERHREFRKTTCDRAFAEKLPALVPPRGNKPPAPTPADLDAAQSIGATLSAARLYPFALPWYRYVLDSDPARPVAAIALAKCLRELGYPDEAPAPIQAASELLPSNPGLLEALGFHLCLLEDPEPAAAAWERSDHIAPYRYVRHFRRADALHEVRLEPEAWHNLARYMEFYPDDPAAVSLRDAIERRLPDDFDPTAKPSSAPRASLLDALKE